MSRTSAHELFKLGLAVLPVSHGKKAPNMTGWPGYRATPEDIDFRFPLRGNVGVILGAPSNGIIDIDNDCDAAARIAAKLMPATATFGREGRPMSHRIYKCPGAASQSFKHDGKTIIEIRSDGAQTIFPGSTHPNGESIEWTDNGRTFADIDRETLEAMVAQVAAASLLVEVNGLTDDEAIATVSAPSLAAKVDGTVGDKVREWLGAPAKPSATKASATPAPDVDLSGFCEPPRCEAAPEPDSTRSGELTPFEDYRQRGDIKTLVERHGWQYIGRDSEGKNDRFTRPGKDSGVSATWNGECWYVWSSNAAPFEEGNGYSLPQVFTELECGGDERAAARALRAQDYGGQRQSKESTGDTGAKGSAATPRLFELYCLGTEPDPPVWLIEDLIEAGACSVIGAEPKTGKSWLALLLAIATASNESTFLGFRVLRHGPVVIYSPEGSRRSTAARLHGLCHGLGLDPAEVAKNIHFVGGSINLPADAERLRATVEAVGAVLVICDPLVSCSTGVDENSSTEIQAVLNALRSVVVAHPDVALVVCHHTSKQSRNVSRAMALRGSSAILAWLDVLVSLRRPEDDHQGPVRVDVFSRDSAELAPFGFELVTGPRENSHQPWFRLGKVDAPDVSGKKPKADHLADVLDGVKRLGPVSRRKLATELGINRNAVGRAVDLLAAKGETHLDEHGLVCIGPVLAPANDNQECLL